MARLITASALVYPATSKVGSFSRNCNISTGTVHAVTGVGFKPSVVHFASGIQDGPSTCFGISDGTTNLVLMYTYATTNHLTDQVAGTPGANTGSQCLYIHHSATQGTKAVAAMDSDGFTLTYADIGSPTAIAVVTMWTAFR